MSAARRRGAQGSTKRVQRNLGRRVLGVLFGAALLGAIAAALPRTPAAGGAPPATDQDRSPVAHAPSSAPEPRPHNGNSQPERAPELRRGASEPSESSPWASPEACARFVEAGRVANPKTVRESARIGTWNVRWYPDGGPGRKAATRGTDIAWLACAIAVLDVDVLAVQEFKTLPRARERTNELLRELDRLTAGRWQAAFDDCPNEATQHTGLLWNTSRATASALRTQGELNPHGEPCKDSLRPGFGAHFRFVGGQSTHVISVHYKSGTERRSHELRKASFEAMAAATRRAETLVPGADVIFAGDFNTMGCPKCSPGIGALEERSSFGELLARAGLAWAAADLDCSEYFRGDGSLLDGFALSRGARARLRGPVRVSGYCAVLGCRDDVKKAPTAARDALSDHCPVVLELGKN